jgi:hypothetical protein
MTRMKLAIAGALSLPIARSPPGASVSWPVRVWQPAQALAKTVLPRCWAASGGCVCPAQPQRRRARAAAAANGRRPLAHVVGVAE